MNLIEAKMSDPRLYFAKIGKVRETSSVQSDGGQFKTYKGRGVFKVLAVNPSKEELSAIYGVEMKKDQVYVGKDQNNNPTATIKFILETVPEYCNGVELKFPIQYNLVGNVKYNRDQTKVQVLTSFGEAYYIDKENAKNKTLPENMKWVQGDYHVSFDGEPMLVNFLKVLLNLINKNKSENGSFVMIDNPEDAMIVLDNVKEYFKGNFSELKEIVNIAKNNKFRGLVGVRTGSDNKIYHQFVTELPMKFGHDDVNYLERKLTELKEVTKRYDDVDFGQFPYEFIENKTSFTNFSNSAASPEYQSSAAPSYPPQSAPIDDIPDWLK